MDGAKNEIKILASYVEAGQSIYIGRDPGGQVFVARTCDGQVYSDRSPGALKLVERAKTGAVTSNDLEDYHAKNPKSISHSRL